LEACKINLEVIKRQIKHQYSEELTLNSPNFDCYFRCGLHASVKIPKGLYNIIARMIADEYEKFIAGLQKEFDSL